MSSGSWVGKSSAHAQMLVHQLRYSRIRRCGGGIVQINRAIHAGLLLKEMGVVNPQDSGFIAQQGMAFFDLS
jgi:hypothetical protein